MCTKINIQNLYQGLDLTKITQYDLAEKLKLASVLVSVDSQVSDEQLRIAELFAFAENHKLKDLLNILEILYP